MSTFNIKETDYKGFKLINYYENKIIIPNNNNNTGKRYQSKNMIASILSSMNRTKKVIKDYAHGTYWDYAITLTLAPDKTKDRYNKEISVKQISKLLNNYKTKYPDFLYMLIPEYHKDGAIHFHGYLKNIPSCDLIKTRKTNKYGRYIYNWKHWHNRIGYTRLDTMPDNIEERIKMNNYTIKYITLDLMIQSKVYNKKRYYCSKGLPKPKAKYLTSSNVLLTFADNMNNYSNDILSYTSHDFKRKQEKEYIIVNTLHNIYLKDS